MSPVQGSHPVRYDFCDVYSLFTCLLQCGVTLSGMQRRSMGQMKPGVIVMSASSEGSSNFVALWLSQTSLQICCTEVAESAKYLLLRNSSQVAAPYVEHS